MAGGRHCYGRRVATQWGACRLIARLPALVIPAQAGTQQRDFRLSVFGFADAHCAAHEKGVRRTHRKHEEIHTGEPSDPARWQKNLQGQSHHKILRPERVDTTPAGNRKAPVTGNRNSKARTGPTHVALAIAALYVPPQSMCRPVRPESQFCWDGPGVLVVKPAVHRREQTVDLHRRS